MTDDDVEELAAKVFSGGPIVARLLDQGRLNESVTLTPDECLRVHALVEALNRYAMTIANRLLSQEPR